MEELGVCGVGQRDFGKTWEHSCACERETPGMKEARMKEPQFKSSSCLPVTQIRLQSTALVLAPMTPQDGPGVEQVQAGPLTAGVCKNNCGRGLKF